MSKFAFLAQTVDIADLALRQDVLVKIGSMNREDISFWGTARREGT
jgi:hypothetical protein